MAGAGFKTFNTGDVLTASDVNTYLMQQTVMVFADSSARSTALGANVAEGMISYLKDTNAVEVYNGSAWVSSDDPNAIQNTIVDAKGDLISATAADTPARLPVGSNGQTLVADSSETTGLGWANNFAAGKNKIINGDFRFNQRNFTSNTASVTYNFDRWRQVNGGATGVLTVTPQTFTSGTAPVSGYEAQNFVQCVTTNGVSTGTYAILGQAIEDVRTLAGQTATISFWAKAGSGTPKIAVELEQEFGTGGSPSANVTTYAGQVTLSTSWARYSVTVAVPSISGKTLGTNANSSDLLVSLWLSSGSDFNSRNGSLGLQNNTFQIWGVQAEAGSVATSFQTATGNPASELAACQRYYVRSTSQSAYGWFPAWAGTTSTTAFNLTYNLPVQMRIAPTSIEYGGALRLNAANDAGISITSLTFASVATPVMGASTGVSATATSNTFYRIQANNDVNAYIGWSAEL